MNQNGFLNILIAIIVLGAIAAAGVYFLTKEKLYKNTQYGYEINYLRNFVLYEDTSEVVISSNKYPPEDKLQSMEIVSISTINTKNSPNDTTFDFNCYDTISSQDASVLIRNKIIVINGVEFHEYVTSYGASSNGPSTYVETYGVVRNNRCYSIGLAIANVSDKEESIAILRKIINSFKFTNLESIPPSTLTDVVAIKDNSIPVIESISPLYGPVGTFIELYGKNIYEPIGNNIKVWIEDSTGKAISFNSSDAAVGSSTYLEIRLSDYICSTYNKPSCLDMNPGIYKIYIYNLDKKSNIVQFTVTK